jgi:hypothetical protein
MTTTSPQGTHPRFYQRTWVIITATAFVALVFGTVIGIRGADATGDPKYKAQTENLTAAKSELAFAKASLGDAQESLAETEDRAADLEDRLKAVEGHLDERKAALRKREADLKKTVLALRDRKALLKEAKADLLEREEAVTAAEALIEDTTVPGDGTFQVGVDIERGLYSSAGKQGCHYAVTGDADRTDVLINKQTAGPATVSLRADTWFVTRGCAEWTRQ